MKKPEILTSEEIIQRIAGMEDDAQDALLQVCAMLMDCFNDESDKCAVIVTQDGPLFGIAMVNKSDIGSAVELLDEAAVSFKEALVEGAPPREMWN
jgi:hypothetical protein